MLHYDRSIYCSRIYTHKISSQTTLIYTRAQVMLRFVRFFFCIYVGHTFFVNTLLHEYPSYSGITIDVTILTILTKDVNKVKLTIPILNISLIPQRNAWVSNHLGSSFVFYQNLTASQVSCSVWRHTSWFLFILLPQTCEIHWKVNVVQIHLSCANFR